MKHHPNSARAYFEIEKEGLLSKMRMLVLETLIRLPASTASEIAEHMPPSPGGRGGAGNVHARLTELVQRGVVAVADTRECNVTHRQVDVYRVTGELPTKPRIPPKAVMTKKLRAALRKVYKSAATAEDRRAIHRAVQLIDASDRDALEAFTRAGFSDV